MLCDMDMRMCLLVSENELFVGICLDVMEDEKVYLVKVDFFGVLKDDIKVVIDGE